MPTLQQSTDPAALGQSQTSLPDNYVPKSVTHVAKFKPSSIVVYKKFEGFDRSKTEQELANLEKGKNGDYNGYLSPQTARQIRSMLENWLLSLEWNITRGWKMSVKDAMKDKKVRQEFAPTFVTLTLPATQKHDDNFVKRQMLWRFIQQLQRKYYVKFYFWRAEPQENGNIHFHILVDKWIHWRRIRAEWNVILDDHGYIEDYRNNQAQKHKNGFCFDQKAFQGYTDRCRDTARNTKTKFDAKRARDEAYAKQKNAYDAGVLENWTNPNSTDIHSIAKLDSITSYVVKYVTKDKDHKANQLQVIEKGENGNDIIVSKPSIRKINGRIWGCSDELRKLKHYEETIAEEIDFSTFCYDGEAFDTVRKLQYELPKADIINDEEAGLLILMLRNEKLYEYLKINSPKMYDKYFTHYEMTYYNLYKPEKISEILATMYQLIVFSNIFGSNNKTNDANVQDNQHEPDQAETAFWVQTSIFSNSISDADIPF